MSQLIKTYFFSFILAFFSCDREKEVLVNNVDGLKFVVSTNYDNFEETETYYYYELKTNKDSVLIGKIWCLATGYEDFGLTEFNGEI